ncbi:MAG: hypothetical protein M3003_04995 [Candidatus Dormibacteraeota bacterium]|nr:hypothetical protein [Candidatus Dormibacteraeota bacterium]
MKRTAVGAAPDGVGDGPVVGDGTGVAVVRVAEGIVDALGLALGVA